uniref:Uncharacterized protein n=1 Tax=Glossina palpalis gambiensis TaxID=67801 RepID=A0A1B0B3U8_9MUSC
MRTAKATRTNSSNMTVVISIFPLNHIYIWMCLHILDEFLLSYTKIGLKWMLKYIIRILMSLNIFTQQNNMKHSATLLKMLHTCKNGLRTQHIDRRIT